MSSRAPVQESPPWFDDAIPTYLSRLNPRHALVGVRAKPTPCPECKPATIYGMTPQGSQRSGVALMRPRARLVGLIGEDLISDEPVAVVELVKNSYDADASSVRVDIDSSDSGTIVVTDDGHGMDLDTVLNAWLEPGTITKQRQARSPNGRIYQGAKGIGRFASARLAQTLLLETCSGQASPLVTVLFDWGRFDDESYLDDIEILWDLSDDRPFDHGTRLTLQGLRKVWNAEDYQALHARLSRLISPLDKLHDFRIELTIPEQPELSGAVGAPELLSEPRYQLTGQLDAQGCFSGQILYGRKVTQAYKNHRIGDAAELPSCGPFDVEIRAWDRDREGLQPLTESLGLGIREIRRTLDDYSGVSIYRDGFRVYPYGQRGNDWLQLDNRSRQNPSMRLANNQLITAIRISRRDNPDLRDRSNREGMVVNPQLAALESWFKEILSLLEAERYDVRPRRTESKLGEPLFEAFDLTETVTEVKQQLGERHPVTGIVERAERQVSDGVDRVQEVFSRLLMSAGLGQMVDLVLHEIGSPIGKVNRQMAIASKTLRGSTNTELIDKLSPMFVSVSGWLEEIHVLRQRLDPQTAGKRGRATTFTVEDEIEDTFGLYSALIEARGISFTVETPSEPVKVQMARSALSQVLANLVDNSIFWLSRIETDRRIAVQLTRITNGFTISINDSGLGVAASDLLNIFEPYFSRKPNGMGLGLYYARLVMEPYGRLIYRDDCALPGACFKAIFERSVGL